MLESVWAALCLRTASSVLAYLGFVALGLTACADSHFRADNLDTARMRALASDPFTPVHTKGVAGGHFSCTTRAARYVPATGEPFDFASIQPSQVLCVLDLPAGSADQARLQTQASQLLRHAAETGWAPFVRGGQLRFSKRLVGAWAEASVSLVGGELAVRLSAPPHTSTGFAPTASELRMGSACLSAATAQSQPPDCYPR